VFGHRANAAFPYLGVQNGDRLAVGEVTLRVFETPGHTPEGISILAEIDKRDRLFTGDTLFVGDVGRPDLIGSKGFSPEQMAGMLYDSLHEKLLVLPDETEVYPAHGACSLCGRNMSRETMSTTGEQRKFNYALQPMPKEDFVNIMTTDLPEVPAYFTRDAEINRTEAVPLGELPEIARLTPGQVQRFQAEGHRILDVRTAAAFGAGHVPGSINIGLGGQFASWAGSLIPMGTPIVIVAQDDDSVSEAVTRLARVGFESVEGLLDGGVYVWDKAGLGLGQIPQMPVDELQARIGERAELQIIDVRRPSEYSGGHVPNAANTQLGALVSLADKYDSSKPTAVICGSEYRSSAATSLLKQLGFQELFNVVGGTAAWVAAGYQVEGADA